MKIYTKTGDEGQTGLFNGKRVPKNSSLVCVFGLLDEVNSRLGFLRHALEQEKELAPEVQSIQSQIFSIGSYFASEFEQKKFISDLDSWIAKLEASIDRMEGSLPVLKNFILPGGTQAACWAHLCRTSVRTTEREVVALEHPDDCGAALIYLNRLSDYFFVLARYINYVSSVEDPTWSLTD